MRATEDRELEGFESEQARESGLEREHEEEMPEARQDQTIDAHREGRAIDAMRDILEHRQVIVNDLKLPKRQLDALEALKAAVDGRDGELHQFVYASDRRTMLEQALAVLQPELVRDVDAVFADLVERVGLLRVDLVALEDAQDELHETLHHHEQAETETSDKPAQDPGDTRLDGPARSVQKPPTSLTGPDLKPPPPQPTTLLEPAIAEPKKPPTSLTGPDLKPSPAVPSTLDGPESKIAPRSPTTLGDPKDLAAAGESIPEPQRLKPKPMWARGQPIDGRSAAKQGSATLQPIDGRSAAKQEIGHSTCRIDGRSAAARQGSATLQPEGSPGGGKKRPDET